MPCSGASVSITFRYRFGLGGGIHKIFTKPEHTRVKLGLIQIRIRPRFIIGRQTQKYTRGPTGKGRMARNIGSLNDPSCGTGAFIIQ